ncbi:hypothetical protein CTAYLR_006886 [Chrysophaeum taylorii]|uniref:SSD domain-containing protein n=1 Tax=Chrysophaeum taylorii TaxID=2483200 RepID=A0AAD7XQC5_9STRA|nr:hypothetical protein CTAYLR_006886 [Chrysophaeum taylorii]
MASFLQHVDKKIGDGFEGLSRGVAKYPIRVLCLSLVVCFASSVGLRWTSIESDEDDLYLPRHATSVKQAEWVSKTYALSEDQGAKSLSMFCVSATSHKNVLRSKESLASLFEMIDVVWSSRGGGGGGGGSSSLLSQAKLNGFGNPMEMSPYGYWNKSKEALERDNDWRRTLYRQPSNPYGLTSVDKEGHLSAERQSLGHLLGKYEVSEEEEEVVSADAFQVKFWVRGDCRDKFLRAADEAVAEASPNDYLHCYLHDHTSYRDAVLGAIAHDLGLVGISVGLLCAFATACFAVRGGWRLGPAAMASVVVSLVTTFGLWMMCGGYFHNLMGAVLFMVLGLGVDDAFVIVAAVEAELATRGDVADVDDVLAKAMRNAGASVLVTSATDAAAFAACALVSRIPAIQSFCAVAALSVLMDFFFQVTFFLSCVAIELRRRIDHRQRAARILQTELPDDRPGEERTWSRAIARAILSRPARLAAAATTIALFALGVAGSSRLEMEYESKWLAPSGSMARKASDVEDKYFVSSNAMFVRVYSKHDSQTLFDNIDDYRRAVDKLRGLSWNEKAKFWLDDGFDDFVADDPAAWSDRREFDFQTSLYALERKHYADRLAFRAFNESTKFASSSSSSSSGPCGNTALPTTNKYTAANATLILERLARDDYGLCATRIEFSWRKVEDKATLITRLDEAQRKLDSVKGARRLNMFVARSPTLEALSLTWDSVRKSVGLCAAAVALCCLALLGRLWAAALMLLVVGLIDVILLGALYWIGEYVNMVTAVILTLAIGLSVDFSAHVTHAFLHSEDHRDPAVDALARMFSPVSKGAGSTLLAISPMAASTSYVIRLFCTICALIIGLGLFMGIVVVPGILHTFTSGGSPTRTTPQPGDDTLPAASFSHRRFPKTHPDPSYVLLEENDDDDDDDDAAAASRLRVLELCRTDDV